MSSDSMQGMHYTPNMNMSGIPNQNDMRMNSSGIHTHNMSNVNPLSFNRDISKEQQLEAMSFAHMSSAVGFKDDEDEDEEEDEPLTPRIEDKDDQMYDRKVRGRPRKYPKVEKPIIPKKRGRPRKQIINPETNEIIDSTHQKYKFINRTIIDSISVTEPTTKKILTEEERQELIKSKDRRGRPRKFPVELTGTTIRGVRIGGTTHKQRGRPKKTNSDNTGMNSDSSNAGEFKSKKTRGRPRKTPISNELENISTPKPRGRPRKDVVQMNMSSVENDLKNENDIKLSKLYLKEIMTPGLKDTGIPRGVNE